MQGGYVVKFNGNITYSPCILIHNPLAFESVIHQARPSL